MKKNIYYILFATILLSSCNYFFSRHQENKLLAEIDGKKLRMSDLAGIFPRGLSKADSIEFINNYVNNWARKCVMAAKAEKHLDNNKKDISREMEDYRMALLIFRYETQCLEKGFNVQDVVVEEPAVVAEETPGNMVEEKTFIRVVYFNVPNNNPNAGKLKSVLRPYKGRQQVDSLCACLHIQPNYLSDQWKDLEFYANNLPFSVEALETAIKNNNTLLELVDNNAQHILVIRDVKKDNETHVVEQPQEKGTVSLIKLKEDFLKKIANDAYNEALDNHQLKIYINE